MRGWARCECSNCGAQIEEFGTHGLSCRFSRGRHSRHASLNDIIKLSLDTAKIPSHLEPSGLYRSDGKRPDGASVVPWTRGKILVKACYYLEGDGPLALDCYEIVDEVVASVATENIPNIRAIAEKLTRKPPSHPHHEQWVSYARNCVQSGLDYFVNQLTSSLKMSLAIFKGCRLFSPQKVREMKPTAQSLDESLSCIPFIDAAEREGLKEELPTYLARVADIDKMFDQLEWWKLNSSTLPNWSTAAKKIVLVQPSSAAAERVFSLLKQSFGEQQDSSLQDYIEASLMLQFNKR